MTERRGDGETGRPATFCSHAPTLPRSHALATLLVLILSIAPPVQAQDAASFARMGFGARGIALGNALVADTAASAYYNPALAPFVQRQHLEASTAFLTFDRTLQFLAFAAPLKPHAGIAAGLTHAGVSNIDGRDNSGYHTRTLSTDEYAFFLAFGTHLTERVTLGAALKYYYARYLDTIEPVEGIGLDLGMTARLTDRLHLGLAANDLLARYTWDTSGAYEGAGRRTTEYLPTRLRLGGTYCLAGGRVRLMGEVEARFSRRSGGNDETETVRQTFVRLGGSYHLADRFTARLGLSRQVGISDALGIRPSAGFGLRQSVGQLDLGAAYAFVWERGVGDPLHVVSLRLFL